MIGISTRQQSAEQAPARRAAPRRRRYARREVLRLSVLAPLGTALLAACGGAATATVGTTSGTTSPSTSVAPSASASTSVASGTASASAATTTSPAAAATTTSPAAAATTASATATTSAATAASPAAAPPSAAVRTISWFANDPGDAGLQFFKGMFAQFAKENPQYQVQLTNSDDTKTATSIAGGVYPDVQDTEARLLPSWVYKQAETDITSYVQKAKVNQADYSATQMTKVVFNGKWYGIPWDATPTVIAYNKTLFRNAGVTEPPKKWGDAGWTWDAFLQAARRVTSGSGAAATFGWGYSAFWPYYLPWAWSNGGEFANQERTQITITDSAFSDAFQWVADIANVQHASPSATQAKQATWNAGRIAMMPIDPYNTVGLDQAMKTTEWDLAPYPVGKAGAFTRTPADVACLVNHAPNPDGGMAAILYVVGPTGQKMLGQAGYVPVLLSALQSPDFLQTGGHVTRQVFADALPASRPEPIPFIYPDVNPLFSKALPDLLAAKITAKDMMAQLQPPVQAILDKAPPAWRVLD